MLGNDEVKSQDEKGSDGGEGGSPSHGDHDLAFNEEEEEERDPSAAQPSDAATSKDLEAKIGETEGGKEGVVVVEWDEKSEENSESKDVSAGLVESAKESHHGNGKSDSSSDETGTVTSSKDESHDSINETVAFGELVKSTDSLHAKVSPVTQNVLAETSDSVAEPSNEPVKSVASVPDVQTIHNDNASLEKSTGSQVEATDLAVKKNEDEEHPITDQNVRTLSLEEPKPREFDNEVSASVSHSPIPESTLGAEHVKDSDAPESSENQVLTSFSLLVLYSLYQFN